MGIENIKGLFTAKLKQYSEEFNVPYSAIKILIFYSDASESIEFNLYVKNAFEKKLSLQYDILDKKFDLFGQVQMANMILNQILNAYCSELQCEMKDVRVQLLPTSDTDETVCMALINNLEFVRWISFDEFGL